MNVTEDQVSLRLDRLQLKNFRCFAGISIDFHPRLTVIVANNGQGKTAVLDAVAIALGPFIGGFDEGKDRAFMADDIRMNGSPTGNRMEFADGGASVVAEGIVDSRSVHWTRKLIGPRSRTTWKEAKPLVEWAKFLQSEVRREITETLPPTDLPLVAYYPTDRLWNIRRLPYRKIPRTSRTVGYTHCLESGSDFHLMADWFRYWSIASLDRRLIAHQRGTLWRPDAVDAALEGIQSSINRCLAPSGWGDIRFDVEKQEIVATHRDHGVLPIGMLSDGIRAVLTLTADIAFRAVKLNQHHAAIAPELAQGIVLIDEVDMHLHPSWQQLILPSLSETFPKLQFIITTHSPQVLSTVESASIRMLQPVPNDGALPGVYRTSSPNREIEGIGSGSAMIHVMKVDPVPPTESAEKLGRYKALIEQDAQESTEAVDLRTWLDSHYGNDHPLLQECDQLLRLSQFRNRIAKKIPASSGDTEA